RIVFPQYAACHPPKAIASEICCLNILARRITTLIASAYSVAVIAPGSEYAAVQIGSFCTLMSLRYFSLRISLSNLGRKDILLSKESPRTVFSVTAPIVDRLPHENE